jgi:mannose-6-phosphate isomerase-like protein (cupin superfamily)
MRQPAPKLGQCWNLHGLIAKGVTFRTLLGTYAVKETDSEGGDTPALDILSLHFAHLKDEKDQQTPHKEDEAYYVIAGRGAIVIEGKRHDLEAGSLIFVPRCAEHQFVDFEKDGLSLLVVFSPNFTG